MVNDPRLELLNVNAWREGGKQVLTDVCAQFATGVTVIVGKNGSGKSTLLEVVSLMFEGRANGLVTLDDEDINQLDPMEVRRRIGLLFQKSTPFSKMSIFDNVVAGLRLRSVHLPGRGPDFTPRVQAVLRQVALLDDLSARLHQVGTGLSGGQIKRLCLARTLITDPEVLLLDEPFAGVDEGSAGILEVLIRSLGGTKVVIVVTHDKDQAKRLTGNIWQMKEGRFARRDS